MLEAMAMENISLWLMREIVDGIYKWPGCNLVDYTVGNVCLLT